jgi:CheY-like chemotaxis protein
MTTAQHTRHDARPRFRAQPVCHRALAPRVLVVAEDESFRRWARGQLRESGFEIVLADDGFAAATSVERDPPDMIVVDHSLPWFGVICLLTQVWRDSARPKVSVLLVAPRATDSFLKACHAVGIAVLVRRAGAPKAVLHVPVPELQMMQCAVAAGVGNPSWERSP